MNIFNFINLIASKVLGEAFPYILAVVFILLGIYQIDKSYDKRDYIKKLMEQVEDENEKKSLEWYINFLNLHIYGFLVLVSLVCLPLFVYHDAISEFIIDLDIPGFLGFAILSLLVGFVTRFLLSIRRNSQKTISESLDQDHRPPVLYLRSFRVDDEAPKDLLDYIFTNKSKIFTYEDMALGLAQSVGPAIGIAAPEKIFQSGGAAKQIVEDWKKEIVKYMKQASLIIMRPYDSEGVLWEFERLIELEVLNKTILYTQFNINSLEDVNRNYLDFRNKVLDKFNIDIGEHNPKMPIRYFDEKNTVYYTNETFDIPEFRKVFYEQFIVAKKNGKTSAFFFDK